MRHILLLTIVCALCPAVRAQHVFQGISLSDALIELDQSSRRYDISFVYDELEDFTVTKTVKRGRSLPDAVREVCGFYPVRVKVRGRDILVECTNKERTKLTGHLIDSQGQPVAYANIMLFHPSDSSLLTGGVSNEAGDFVIPCAASPVFVRISCVGLKTIERLLPVAPVGTIRMLTENNYLRNVNISGHPPIISYQGGRLQYIVRQSRFTNGLSALELLNRVPMVSIVARQPSILGKGPARYMLNGRVMELGDDAMQQKLWSLRAEDIDRIEVISIPSGRYQDEHGGGFINIVTRSDQSLGWRGDIGVQAAHGDDWSERLNGSVNYASEKLDWGADVSGSQTTSLEETQLDYQHDFPQPGYDYSHYSKRGRDRALKASSQFRFTPWRPLELGGMLSFQIGQSYNNLTDISQQYISKSEEPQLAKNIHSLSSLQPRQPSHTFSLTAYCEWHLDDKGKTSCLTYNHYRKGEKTVSTVYSNQMQEDGLSPIGTVANVGDNTYHIQSVKFDNTLPYPFATIEAGVAYTLINNYADILSWKEEVGLLSNMLIDHYSYEEKTLAYYLAIHKKLATRMTLYAGLRYDRSWLKRRTEEGGGARKYSLRGNNSSFHHYLPTLRLSHQLRREGQLGIQWGISIHRPYFYELSPNFLYRNLDASISGNPALQLGTTQHLEMTYNDSRHLFATFYHQHQTNQTIMMTTERKTIPVDGYKSDKTGLLLNYRRRFGERLNLAAECEGYYYNIKDEYGHDNDISRTSSPIIDRKKTWVEALPPLWGWGGRFSLTADLYLDHRQSLLLNVRYSQWLADYIGMDRYKAYALPEVSLHYSLLDSRLKLSLAVKDPFRQYVTDMTRLYYNDAEHYHTHHHAQSVSLTATYALGERKVRRIHHDMKDTESKRAEKK